MRFSNSFGYAIKRRQALGQLVPTDSLALFVDPAAQMIDSSETNMPYRPLFIGSEVVDNSTFTDFTFDYTSIGEASPFYESDFSAGTDGWGGYGGTLSAPETEPVTGESNTLKFMSDSSDGVHRVSKNVLPNDDQYYRIKAKIYIPSSNTTIKKVVINLAYSPIGGYTVSTLDAWVDINFELYKPKNNINWLHILGGDSTGNVYFTGTDGDIFYIKDVHVQRVGMLAHWVFDDYFHTQEGTGKTVLQDLTGNGYDLTASAGFDYTHQLTGDDPNYRNGNSLRFDGVDDYAYRPAADATAFNPDTGDFSIAGWIYLTGNSNGGVIGKGYANPDYKFWRLWDQGGLLRFQVGDGSGVLWWITDGYVYTNPQWVHFAITLDRDGEQRFYINGQLYESQNITNTIDISNNYDLVIGRHPYFDSYYCENTYAELAYFNRALSATEVKALSKKPRHWTWNESGTLDRSGWSSVLSSGAELSQDLTTTNPQLYKEQKNSDISYFGNTTSHTITLDDGTWTLASVKPVTNVETNLSNFVEDFSQGGAEYGNNLVLNGGGSETTDWIDSDSDGIADGWVAFNGQPSITSGNGFVGNAQRLYADVTQNTILKRHNVQPISGGDIITLSFKYRHNNGLTPYLWFRQSDGALVSTLDCGYISSNPNSAASYWERSFEVPSGAEKVDVFFYVRESNGNAQAGDWIEVDEVEVKQVSNGNHGLTQGSLESNQPVYPYAWKFDGVDDYVDFGDVLDIHTNSAIINLWVKYDYSSASYMTILSKVGVSGSSVYGGIRLLTGSSKDNVFLSLANHDKSKISEGLVTATNIGDNNFHLLSVVIDRVNNIAYIYVDAELTGNLSLTDISGEDIYATNNLLLGYSSTNNIFVGKIAPVLYYLFDGQNGRAASLRSDYVTHYIQKIYNNIKKYFQE